MFAEAESLMRGIADLGLGGLQRIGNSVVKNGEVRGRGPTTGKHLATYKLKGL